MRLERTRRFRLVGEDGTLWTTDDPEKMLSYVRTLRRMDEHDIRRHRKKIQEAQSSIKRLDEIEIQLKEEI